ncbi:MFS transporter [Chloroflexi bacterium TSY]|nr:MFS transporter [Chloroflexi bacterium TSY]
MSTLLRQRNFSLLWWGGLISLTGTRVLSVALPFYVYQQTGSTLATATMVMATIVPSMLFSTIAGVLVDRWDRRQVMVVTNLILMFVLLPLFAVPITGWVWLVYIVAFLEAMVSIFFRLAENALLPQIVAPNQLLTANSLNSLNDTLARLIGPALGGVLFGIWGLESVIVFDSISYLLAGLLMFFVNAWPEKTRAHSASDDSTTLSWSGFRHEWQDGLSIVRREHAIAMLFVVTGVTTLGGTMMDPLFAPFFYDVLQTNAATYGWVLTMQGIGGILGGVLIGQRASRINPTYLFSISSITAGLILFIMYQTVSIPLVFLLYFIVGIPSVGARVGLQTLFQQNVADAYRGRVGGLSTMIGSTLELFSVGFAGITAEIVGIVPILSIACGITVLAGIIGLWLLPRTGLSTAIN